MNVQVKQIKLDTEHDNQKWIVLEGSVEGCPAVTKRRSINTAALVDRSLTFANEKAKLIADVEEYHARYLAVQKELENL
jgi:hypothetical protein